MDKPVKTFKEFSEPVMLTVYFYDYRKGASGKLTTERVNTVRLARMKKTNVTTIEIVKVIANDGTIVFESTGDGNYYNK